MEWRIGVHLGDVLIEGDDILGDGVNIAARLEGIAEPGGIVLARLPPLRWQLQRPLDHRYERPLGPLELALFAVRS
jgi:class 3 adenylate cyclase